jgi:hypothetical protein
VGTTAGAGIIVPDSHDPDIIACIGWQPIQIVLLLGYLSALILLRNRQISLYYRIYLFLDSIDFPFRQSMTEVVITFGFLLFDVGVEGAIAVEHPDYGLVQDVFCRMHTGISLFLHCSKPRSQFHLTI